MRILFFILLSVCVRSTAQDNKSKTIDRLSESLFQRGTQNVNKCTPWHHLQCVFITGTEVYKDGREGKSTRHWWRMSYIGQACTSQHGTGFGRLFEGLFAIPHYLGVGLGNGTGYIIFLIRGSPDKIQVRKQMRRQKKSLKKSEQGNMKRDLN